MKIYTPPGKEVWKGRKSKGSAYMHEKIGFLNLDSIPALTSNRHIALLGYCCDEGVKRNMGRPGAADGPDSIREALARLANHLPASCEVWDAGNISCLDGDMEAAQQAVGEKVAQLREQGIFPLLLGGGHDLSYGHFHGLKSAKKEPGRIGIVNFDAHFDLRSLQGKGNSGTPFFQLAKEHKAMEDQFYYFCLGVREDANDASLFKTAADHKVQFILKTDFTMSRQRQVQEELLEFSGLVDSLYITIDLDGFSSAYAPGVSAPSPMGFEPEIVLESLKTLLQTGKVISMDVVELNPEFDRDQQTAKLAASLIHSIIHRLALLEP